MDLLLEPFLVEERESVGCEIYLNICLLLSLLPEKDGQDFRNKERIEALPNSSVICWTLPASNERKGKSTATFNDMKVCQNADS